MKNKLQQLKKELQNQLEKIADVSAPSSTAGTSLANFEKKYLGKKGELANKFTLDIVLQL